MKHPTVLLLCLLALQSIAFEGIFAEDIEGSGDDDDVFFPVVPEVIDPEITDPEITDPEITDPEITDPEIKDPEITDPEITEPKLVDPELLAPDAPLDGEKTVVEEPKSIEEILPNAAPEDGVPAEIPVGEEPDVDPVVKPEDDIEKEVVAPETKEDDVLPGGVEEVPVDDGVVETPEEIPVDEVVPPPEEQLSVPVDVPAEPNVMRSEGDDGEAEAAGGDSEDEGVYTTPGDPTADTPIEPELLSADGSPVFSVDCPSSKVVPLYTAVTIRCRVTSESELTNTYFYWHHYVVIHLKDDEITDEHEFKVIENNSSKIMLLPVDQSEVIVSGSVNTTTWAREGGYMGLVFPQANNSAYLELKIEHMTNQMYRRHFFTAENEVGSVDYVIEFQRESDADNSASPVMSPVTSQLAYLLTFLAVSAFFH